MKRRLFVGLIMLTLLCVVLNACNMNTTTPTTPPGTTQLTLSDEGNIGVDGRGYFYYQKMLTPLTVTTTYHGVIFTLNIWSFSSIICAIKFFSYIFIRKTKVHLIRYHKDFFKMDTSFILDNHLPNVRCHLHRNNHLFEFQ